MTPSTHHTGRARGPTSTPRGPIAPWLVAFGLLFLPLAVSSAPLGAAADSGVLGAEAQQSASLQAQHGDVDRSGLSEVRLRDPGQRWDEDDRQWVWRLEWSEWAMAAGLGVVLAAGLLVWLLARLPKPTLARGRWFDAVRSLDVDWLVAGYLLAAASIAVFLYSGAFAFLSSEAERVVKFGPLATAGPLTGLLGILFTKATKKKILVGAVAGEGSGSFLGLVRVRKDEKLRQRIAALAADYEVGLIKRTVFEIVKEAYDQGLLQDDERDEFLYGPNGKDGDGVGGLIGFQPGKDKGSTFLNSQDALTFATRLVTLDALEKRLKELEKGLPKEERRTFPDRRAILEQGMFRERRESTNGDKDEKRTRKRRSRHRRVESDWQPTIHGSEQRVA